MCTRFKSCGSNPTGYINQRKILYLFSKKSDPITPVNNIIYVPRPSNDSLAIYCMCGDAIPRVLCGLNWDDSAIIYYPSGRTQADAVTILYAKIQQYII